MDKRTWIIVGVVVIVLLVARPVFAIKPGASISTRPEIIAAREIVSRVWRQYGYALTITSGTDGSHNAASLHYQGLAEDYRIAGIPNAAINGMVAMIRTLLGGRYDVILEADHLHIEYDPN